MAVCGQPADVQGGLVLRSAGSESLLLSPPRVTAKSGLPITRSISLPSSSSVHPTSPSSHGAVPSAAAALFSLRAALRWIGGIEAARFRKHGFDLNLNYITPRVIALCKPNTSGGLGSIGRDSEAEVGRFLETFHAGRYRVYCLDGSLPSSGASTPSGSPRSVVSTPPATLQSWDQDNVGWMPNSRGCPPSLEDIAAFSEDATTWLRCPHNVAVVQCQDGMGLSGLMICCLLLRQGIFATPDRALSHFRRMRLRRPDKHSHTISPSQARYVSYFFRQVREPLRAQPSSPRFLSNVSVSGLPPALASDTAVAVWMRPKGEERCLPTVWLFASAGCKAAQPFYAEGRYSSTLPCCGGSAELELVLCKPTLLGFGTGVALATRGLPLELARGDIRLAAFSGEFSQRREHFAAWLHTDFLEPQKGVQLRQEQLDLPKLPRMCNFSAEMHLSFAEEPPQL